MARNYAAIPHEYLEEMEALSDAEFGRLARALLRYSMTGEAIALSGNERFYAKRVMMQEDRHQASYTDLSRKRSEAGKTGGRPPKHQVVEAKAPESKSHAKKQPEAKESKKSYTETKTNTKKDSLPPCGGESCAGAAFTPPTLIDVIDFVNTNNLRVDPAAFFQHYEANGWMIGSNHMVNWQAACRKAETWDSNKKTFSSPTDAGDGIQNYVQKMHKKKPVERKM